MIELPDFSKAFSYENDFYLSCDNTRLAKILTHYELFKMIQNLPGAIVECGIFKGASFVRFAGFRDLFGNPFSHKLIGFDTFEEFPPTEYEDDKAFLQNFLKNAGTNLISEEQLYQVLQHKGISKNVELVKGDINVTIPEYLKKHPYLTIAMLNLDTDVYEPSKTILEHLYPRIVKGGLLVLDDYGEFPGETKAVEEYFAPDGIEIKKFPFSVSPCYIVKP